jgi:hypothetical protein
MGDYRNPRICWAHNPPRQMRETRKSVFACECGNRADLNPKRVSKRRSLRRVKGGPP